MNEHLQELLSGGRPMTKLELLQKENEELKKLITELNSKVMLKDKQIKEALRIIEEKCGEYDIPDELEKILKEDE